ncbi:hypothetical protein DO65_4930 [Burkholderia pseudomallei]|nr:hypothetical protein DO65_4930 [Burkholderia pseudomallei]KGW79219.1 hypothetical protein Y046_3833 [Burkholderia pseudomallei MSHR2990]
MAAASAAAELARADRDHLDARLAQQRVRVRVAVVADDDARLDAHHVVAVVPLLAFGREIVAARLDDAQRFEAERLRDDVDERLVLALDVDAVTRIAARAQRERHDPVHDFGEDRDEIAVAEAEHGVEVHRRARVRQPGDDHALGRALGEQRLRELADRLARRALAHADEHDAAADRHHVAAFERRHAVIAVGIAVPDVELRVGERRVEFVDGGDEERLLPARGPVHRVERDAAVDPARRVAREHHVRQRRQHERRLAEIVAKQREHLRALGAGNVARRDPADQELGERTRLEALEPRAHFVDETDADVIRRDLAIEDPLERGRVLHGLGQQVVHLEHLDAALAHLRDEIEVIALRLVHPHHVVEQQLVAVARREALMREARRADEHLAQLADFGMDTDLRDGLGHVDYLFDQSVMSPLWSA